MESVAHEYPCAIGFEERARAILATWARLKVSESKRGLFMPITTFAISGDQSAIDKALAELNAAHEEWWMGMNF
jgi:hypothetical protein